VKSKTKIGVDHKMPNGNKNEGQVIEPTTSCPKHQSLTTGLLRYICMI